MRKQKKFAFIDLFEDFLLEDEKIDFLKNIEEFTGKFKMHDSINTQLVNNYIVNYVLILMILKCYQSREDESNVNLYDRPEDEI